MKLERVILGAPLAPVAVPSRPARPEPVVLLQGIVRSRFSLRRMAHGLEAVGFEVYHTGGPSPRQPLEAQVEKFRRELDQLGQRFQERYPGETPTVHGVGHSLGGIVLRVALAQAAGIRPGRLVATATPFLGARVADLVGSWPGARLLLGPALEDLSWQSPVIRRLAAAATGAPEVGIILGQCQFQPLLPAAWINAWLGLKDTDGTVLGPWRRPLAAARRRPGRPKRPYLHRGKAPGHRPDGTVPDPRPVRSSRGRSIGGARLHAGN